MHVPGAGCKYRNAPRMSPACTAHSRSAKGDNKEELPGGWSQDSWENRSVFLVNSRNGVYSLLLHHATSEASGYLSKLFSSLQHVVRIPFLCPTVGFTEMPGSTITFSSKPFFLHSVIVKMTPGSQSFL